MRLLPLLALATAVAACGPTQRPRAGGERHAKTIVEPPVPPGHVAAMGPLVLESVDVVRHEVGWDLDFVHATRVVAYDVVVAQRGAACLGAKIAGATRDGRGCEGFGTFPPECDAGPPMRARFEVTVKYAIDVAQRCAGETQAYPVRDAHDARAELTAGGMACFRNRNKLRPEASWTSVYALTELSIGEQLSSVTSDAPWLLAQLLEGAQPTFCRDDGAYLSGRPGAAAGEAPAAADQAALARGLLARVAAGATGSSVPLTAGGWKTEHDLWEACNAPQARGDLVAQERCQLLRQLDRFLTDVETAARPETPRGLGAPPVEPTASASKEAPCPSATTSASSGRLCAEPPGGKP